MDNIHFNFEKIDSFNKSFNFIISSRWDGKTTAALVRKAYRAFKKSKYRTVVFRSQTIDITSVYIDSIEKTINKFEEEKIKLTYRLSDKKEGFVDLKIKGEIFIRIISLSCPISRAKSLFLENVVFFIYDEYIRNTRAGEKYQKQEGFKIKEIYTTFVRESPYPIKCYFLGNPYSIFVPLYLEFDIESSKIKLNEIVTGPDWAVDYHSLNPELKKQILAKNPAYQIDDEYFDYAVNAVAVNDKNLRLLANCPNNYRLQIAIRIENRYLGIFINNKFDFDNGYYVSFIPNVGKRRDVFCFDFNNLIENVTLFSYSDREYFASFRDALRRRAVDFQSVECNYYIEELYTYL